MQRIMKNMTECARSAVMVAGETSIYWCVDFVQDVARGCTSLPNLFKLYLRAMIETFEAAKQGVTEGERTLLALMFAHDFLGPSESPEILQCDCEGILLENNHLHNKHHHHRHHPHRYHHHDATATTPPPLTPKIKIK